MERGSYSPPINATALQRSFHYAVGNYCKSIEKDNIDACVRAQNGSHTLIDENNNSITNKDNNNTNNLRTVPQMTPGAIAALTDLAYKFMTENLAVDLEAFSQHANRRTITCDDVLLAARKNPNGLLDRLKQSLEMRRTDGPIDKRSKANLYDYYGDKKKQTRDKALDADTTSSSSDSSSSSTEDDELEANPRKHLASYTLSLSISKKKMYALESSQEEEGVSNTSKTSMALQSSQEDNGIPQHSLESLDEEKSMHHKSLHFSKVSSNYKRRKILNDDEYDYDDDDEENGKQEEEDENELVIFNTSLSPKRLPSSNLNQPIGVLKDEVIDLADDDDD